MPWTYGFVLFSILAIHSPPLASVSSGMASSIRANIGQEPRRRRRPAHSCVECRRRKVKCDRNQPCNNCSGRRRHATCIYNINATTGNVTPISTPSFSTGSYVVDSPEQCDVNALRMSGVTKASLYSAGQPPDDVQRSSTVPSGAGSSPSLPGKDHTTATSEGDDDLHRRLRALEQLLSTCNTRQPPTDENSPAIVLSLHDGRGSLNKSRVFGRSHWMTQIAQVRHRSPHDRGSQSVG